jgi:syntaxin 1B/2/3
MPSQENFNPIVPPSYHSTTTSNQYSPAVTNTQSFAVPYPGQSIEMSHVTKNGNLIWERVNIVRKELESLDEDLRAYKNLILQFTQAAESQAIALQFEHADSTILAKLEGLVRKVTMIKEMPGAQEHQYTQQIKNVRIRVQAARGRFFELQNKASQANRDIKASQIRLLTPDMSIQESREAADNIGDVNILQHAMMSGRSAQAKPVLTAVSQRSRQIIDVHEKLVALSEMFERMEAIVEQQEKPIQEIEEKNIEAHQNVIKGNEQLVVAEASARSRNRKKWWCLLICRMSPKSSHPCANLHSRTYCHNCHCRCHLHASHKQAKGCCGASPRQRLSCRSPQSRLSAAIGAGRRNETLKLVFRYCESGLVK